MKKSLLLLFMLTLCLFTCCSCQKKGSSGYNTKNSFNVKLIKATYKKGNYLVSPYSIEVSLNMLKEGANGNTKKQIEKILPDRKISDISVKNKVNVANALFIKDYYKKLIKNEFKIDLIDNYNSEVIYDEFKTPDVINNWVNKKTDGMIKKILNDIDDDFVLGLANAIAVDVEWEKAFDCADTTKESFTKSNGKKINVEMMHNTYSSSDFKYLESKNAKGVVIPYQSYNPTTGKDDYDNGRNLEFIAILPNDDVNKYIENLTEKEINNLINSAKEASSEYEIHLALPRFKYEYSVDNFKEALMSLGIKDAFDYEKADFTNIMKQSDMKDNIYVSTAIHKTYIDLNEKGTRAAAITYFGVDSYAAIPQEKDIVNIEFNKPFVYMIRDTKTKDVLFFGAVFEPNLWEGKTCSK
ncbi:MAG: hypothetical protein IKX00_04155 [Bacilli bacterium]|nr:hypothetical protein [Bacilli bacterium]